jgi:hypothetical protein
LETRGRLRGRVRFASAKRVTPTSIAAESLRRYRTSARQERRAGAVDEAAAVGTGS